MGENGKSGKTATSTTGEHFDVELIDATFGAIVRGIDLRTIDKSTWDPLYATWLDRGLLIFPDQHLTRDEQDTFARRFGDLEFTAAPISNVTKNGEVRSDDDDDLVKSLRGNQGWHHDSTYMPVQAKGAVFTAEVVPPSGAPTGWADMAAAYDALDDETRSFIANKSAYHSLYYSMGRMNYLPTKNDAGGYDLYGYHDQEVSLRPLVKVHPETGRPNLLAGRHAHDIVGMDPDESVAFLDALDEAACQGDRVHHHSWTVGDAVIWDNRRLMHRGTPWDMTQARVMWHTRIAGNPATEAATNHTDTPPPATLDATAHVEEFNR